MFAIPPLTIPDVVSGYARWRPNDIAVVDGERRFSWRQFVGGYHRAANALLRAGVQHGDKIALLMNSSAELLTMIFAVVKAGGIVVPLSPMFEPKSIARMIGVAQASMLFLTEDNLPLVDAICEETSGLRSAGRLIGFDFAAPGIVPFASFVEGASDQEPDVEITLQDDFNIMFTSGTTGDPKGSVHTHLSRLLYPLGWGLPFGIDQKSVTLLATPLYHNGTWITMLSTLHHGGRVIIMRKFDARSFLEQTQREGATHTFLVPTQIIALLALPDFERFDARSLRMLFTSGSPLPSTTFRDVQERMPHTALHELYGMSEGFATFIGPDDYKKGKAGSVGRPAHFINTDLRLIDDSGNEVEPGSIGEVVGTSALMMRGYYNDPKRTEESLWRAPDGRVYLRSGDLGRFDEDGYLYIVGRSKDMIKSGGINVFPIDIEEAFMKHPEVLEAAVIGIPHPKWGETPLVLVIRRHSATITEADLLAWGNERLGKHQRASALEFRPAFPRNTIGKVMKRDLRQPYWAGHASDLV